MPAWKSKRVKESKKGRWSKLKDSKSKSRKRDSIKPHYTRKISRSSKGDREEFTKFLKSKKRKDAWKPKTSKKNSPKKPKSKTVKKSKRWTRDLDFDAMLEVSQEELNNHRGTGRMFDDKKKNSPGLGLPNWPPKAPSPSKLPPPLFNPSISPSPSINLTEDDYAVLASAAKDAFKSPKPKLLRPMDITGVKSKRNPDLLTPAQILLTKPNDFADKPKKTRKRGYRGKSHKKRGYRGKSHKKKRRKTKKQKGGVPLPPGMRRKTKKLPPGISYKKNRTRKIHNLVGRLRSKSEPTASKTNNKIKRRYSEPITTKEKKMVDLRVQAKIAAALA